MTSIKNNKTKLNPKVLYDQYFTLKSSQGYYRFNQQKKISSENKVFLIFFIKKKRNLFMF